MNNPVLFAGLAFVAVFLFFFGLQRIIDSQRAVIGSRLEQYGGRVAAVPEQFAQTDGESQMARGLNRMMSGGMSQQLAMDLQRADLKLTPAEFMALTLAAVAVGFLVAFALGHSNPVFGLLGGILGFYAPRFWVRRLQAQRLNSFNNQLNDMLILVANSLRSGYSLQQAMEAVSRELPPPVSVEFSRVIREVSLGLNMEEALGHMLQRINSEDLDLIITAINIQHEVGGNLAEILDTIAHTVRERVRIKGQIRALTASQRLSGTVISLLPFALAAFMFIFNQNYFKRMWEDPCGWMMLGFGVITIGLGYFIIQQIVKIEV
ncbi:MAG: type II secretion system F family protein [Chloroflexi bacterium]|nr:type II secretion system F family protein [Chloroflexota bacterium]